MTQWFNAANTFALAAPERETSHALSHVNMGSLQGTSLPASPTVSGNEGHCDPPPPNRAPQSTAAPTADGTDYVKIIESTLILDHREAPAWEHVFSDPALKLRLERIFRRCASPNIINKQDGISTHGILLYGRSGTGKTLLAKAIARHSGFTFYNVTMGEMNFMYAGQSERYVRNRKSLGCMADL